MADLSKAEKLAIARKKLKEYQRKEKDTSYQGTKNSFKKAASKHVTEDKYVPTPNNPSIDPDPEKLPPRAQEFLDSTKEDKVPYELTDTSELSKTFDSEPIISSLGYQSSSHLFNVPVLSKPEPDISGMFVSNNIYNSNKDVSSFFDNIAVSNGLNDNATHNFFTPPGVTNERKEVINDSIEPKETQFTATYFEKHTDQNKFKDADDKSNLSNSSPMKFTEETFYDNTGAHSTQSILSASENLSDGDFHGFESFCTPSIQQSNVTENAENNNENISSEQAKLNSVEEKAPEVADGQHYKLENSQESVIQNSQTNLDRQDNHSVISPIGADFNSTVEPFTIQNPSFSSTESLRQMSLQLNDLISEPASGNIDSGKNGVSELEHRNQELAAMLCFEQQKNEHLQLQLKECQSRILQLESDLGQMQTESEGRIAREIGPLQEQLQLHVQTVGILVGEKTELQSALSKSQQLAKQKAGEAEELQGRLKASRHKVAELEKELSVTSSSKDQLERSVHQLASELETLKHEYKESKKKLEETEEEASEIRQKLNSKAMEFAALQQELQEKQSQLSLTQLRVQQLSMSDNLETERQLEALNQQKISLEHQIGELQQTVRLLTADRDQASQQYQQYVQQLNSQLQSLASKLETTTVENEHLSSREQSLIQHISELEKQLQQQQVQKHHISTAEDAAKIREIEDKLSALEEEKKLLLEKNERQQQQIEDLNVEMEARLRRIEELESFVESMKGDQPDKDRLLAAMESDKVAASRAVAQNQKLKQQLEELQHGFVAMSNDKLELTEQLQHEQHLHKEKSEKLLEMEIEIQKLRNDLEEKKNLLQQLEERVKETERSVVENKNNDLLLKKFEEHLQETNQQLENARVKIETLTIENAELSGGRDQPKNQDTNSLNEKDRLIDSLRDRVQQLEADQETLKAQLQEARTRNNSGPGNNLDLSDVHNEHQAMKEAMEKLQAKFKKTMEEIAELSDEKQRLEHLVLQLQSETETIGEYIALYQTQRSILRQRAKENDEQLARVSRDREEMKMKLQQLNELVRRLVDDKEGTLQRDKDSYIESEKTVETILQNSSPITENGRATATENTPLEVNHIDSAKNVTATSSDGALNDVINKAATAEKIMALLSEIGSSNLVEPQVTENFHPCPWCSGRLITV